VYFKASLAAVRPHSRTQSAAAESPTQQEVREGWSPRRRPSPAYPTRGNSSIPDASLGSCRPASPPVAAIDHPELGVFDPNPINTAAIHSTQVRNHNTAYPNPRLNVLGLGLALLIEGFT